VVVEDVNAAEHRELLENMFRLRARVFRDRLKWDVAVVDGMERDRYDDEGPVYLIYTDEEQKLVKGSLRLLPTTGPTLLDNGSREEMAFASGVLFAGLGEIALRSGIQSILGNFDAGMYRLYRRIGCQVDVLGVTHRFERPVYLGLFPVSRPILENVRSRLRGADRHVRLVGGTGRLAA
jgi:acyl homoserine lactone synthase